MLIPLWLPWTVVAVLVVAALIQPAPADGSEQAREIRAVVLTRAWALVAVVALVAAVVTWDRVRVSEDELREVVDEALALTAEDGGFSYDRIEVLTSDRLGREVVVGFVEQGDADSDDDQLYEVRVGERFEEDGYDGVRVCIEVTPGGAESGQPPAYTTVDEGGCEDE